MVEKLPQKLPVNNFPLGSCELEVREKAIEYNSLPENDPKRETVYEQWKEANLRMLYIITLRNNLEKSINL